MPWYNGEYPPSYKNQPIALRNKAVEIANELLLHGVEEGTAIATGLKRARALMTGKSPNQQEQNKKYKSKPL